jgi:pantothenate kinase
MLRHKKWTSKDRLNERAEEINEICDDINHINEIYTDLAVIVHYQKDNIDNVEKNANDAKKNTEKGVKHLLQAEKYQKSGFKIIMAGAIVGAAVGGPIGLAAGLKLWSLGTAAAGFFLGGAVGKVID